MTRFHDNRTAFVAAVAILLASTAAGQPASSTELGQEVRTLLRKLDAPELARRDEAEKKLIALGADILPLLPEVSPSHSAELRQRLERIRNVVTRARDEAFTHGTTVTLLGKYGLFATCGEIEKQTGNKIVDYREQFGQEISDPELTVNFDKTPFWKALDTLLDQAGLSIYPFADQQAAAIVAAPQPHTARLSHADYQGAFRIEATQFIAERNLRQPNEHSLDLTLEVAWEPRLKPILVAQSLADITATDDADQPVPVAAEDAELETPVNPGSIAAEVHVPLVPPARDARKIAKLTGKLVALLPGRPETFRFANLKADHVEQRRGGAVVTLERALKNNAVWEVRILVRFDDPDAALESYRGWIFNNEAYLETADGKRLKPDGYETTRQTEEEVGIAYLFDVQEGLAGKTFVYQTATVVLDVPIAYTLENLPLP